MCPHYLNAAFTLATKRDDFNAVRKRWKVDQVQLLGWQHAYRKICENGCEMQKMKSTQRGISTFFAFCAPFFRFSHFVPELAFAWKLKGFCGLFFAALIKHEIRLKCKKCIVSVLHFVVCFAKTFVKYPQNAKYEQYIASLIAHHWRCHDSVLSFTLARRLNSQRSSH